MQKLSVFRKIGYGTGGMAFGVQDMVFSTFVLFYYTQVVGLSGTLTGTALFISMVWDAISDPIVGSLSDNLRSRWGRRHPFMALGGIPLALTVLALFMPPMHWDEMGKFYWFLGTCLLLRTFLTLYTIPHTAMPAELTDEYEERTSIIGVKSVLGWINGMFFFMFVMWFVMTPAQNEAGELIDGRLINGNYKILAIVSCAMIAIYTSISTLSTVKFIPLLKRSTREATGNGVVQLFRDFRWALGNRNFRVLCLMMLTQATSAGIAVSLGLIMNTYFWELSTTQLGVVGISGLFASVLTFSLLGPLGRRFDKHRLIQACYLIGLLNGLWLVGLRLLDVLPDNGHWAIFPLWLLSSFIGTSIWVLNGIMISSFTADIVDEQAYKTGFRQEGLFYAVESFAGKAVGGMGSLIGGFVLDFVAFPSGAAPGAVPDDLLFKLGVITGPLLSVVACIPLSLSLLLNLDRKRHAEIQAALAEQRAAAAEGNKAKGHEA